ncbi:hypothetical protein [Labedaea rhizosphaerae]|uniref:Uncharacterized protein n=1 Tax=Labedaea rhizosphaerae TaxID=598644 RepID=A0A4R6S9X2_LABRH|nr:hypothetical protein [Labedaea rhizosphaerae]TDP96177.1 hypothetical protein EV186_104159 [Labedaea rhizosphaerae]
MAKSEFNFHGPTVFINEPRDTVVKDFQNKHSADVTAQLAELLRLVLASNDLSDQEREETARLVDEVAEQADADDPAAEPAEAQSRLSRIGRVVSKAADIATPASKIVEAVAPLFS